ncbi:MAG: hypothetical protein IT490_00090 [Candidatus Contendobacter sp.]|nr:hypothetical protein [Candidatus Contendobacter sp.]
MLPAATLPMVGCKTVFESSRRDDSSFSFIDRQMRFQHEVSSSLPEFFWGSRQSRQIDYQPGAVRGVRLTGQTNAVELSTVQRLPLAALKRLTSPRKLPEKRDINNVISFLAKVERGELPNVLTMKEVSNRLGIHPRELSRIVPEEAGRLSILLANRRAQIREKKKTYRDQVLREEVPAAVSRLLQEGKRPTRREVDKALAFAGIPVRRQEAPFVRQLVQLTLGDKTDLSVSGN